MRAPHHHFTRVAFMVERQHRSFPLGTGQPQRATNDGHPQQREAGLVALREEAPALIDDHPLAVMLEPRSPRSALSPAMPAGDLTGQMERAERGAGLGPGAA